MILNTKRIHNSFWRNFPARAKQMPSKILFVSKKHWPNLCTKIVIVGNSKWVKNHLSNIVFNYLTVLVHTKTIIHLSVGGKWLLTYLAASRLSKFPPLPTSTLVNLLLFINLIYRFLKPSRDRDLFITEL